MPRSHKASNPSRTTAGGPTKVERSDAQVHTKFVMKEVVSPLEQFTSSKEMMRVMYDAFQGHRDAVEKYGTLHKDICPANIRIHNGRGLLLDWDLAQRKAEPTSGEDDRHLDAVFRKLQKRMDQAESSTDTLNADDLVVDDAFSTHIQGLRRSQRGIRAS